MKKASDKIKDLLMLNEKYYLFIKSGNVVSIEYDNEMITVGGKKIKSCTVSRADTGKRMIVAKSSLVPFSKLETVLDKEDATILRNKHLGQHES